jgi:hypothetical protein
MGASTTLKGTIITHGSPITMASEGNLEGELFSIVGAVSFDFRLQLFFRKFCN